MELFKNFRLKIGKTTLARKVSGVRREIIYPGFKKVKNIGIVWDASKVVEFASLSKFHQKMHEKKIEVKILGYYPGKNLPDQYTAIRYLICFKKDELNSFYQPHTTEVNSFIRKQFDILIDINFDKLFPLRYVTSLSNARLRVGLFDHETVSSPFDLMLELQSPVDIEGYLDQVIHYLEMMKDQSSKKS